jgi:hypothetical protein
MANGNRTAWIMSVDGADSLHVDAPQALATLRTVWDDGREPFEGTDAELVPHMLGLGFEVRLTEHPMPAPQPAAGRWDGEISAHGGDVGGDHQDGPSWVRRFVQRNPMDRSYVTTYTVIDFYCFRVQPDPDTWSGGPVGNHGMSLMVSYIECTDPAEPGGSEVRADTRYWDGVIEEHHTDPAAVLATLGYADIQAAHDQMGG